MFEIGASLREARTRRGLSLDDVSTGLRLRERYVTALEEERWELMPGEAYGKGFLRMYAEYLGLNGSLYIDEYNERIAPHEDEPLVLESLAPPNGRNRLLLGGIAGLVAVGAIVAFGSRGTAAPRVQPHKTRVVQAARAELHHPVAAPPPKPALAHIRALTSRSWLSVRIGGANGAEIFRGFLEPGHELSYGLRRNVWLRIGRPKALAIRIGPDLVNGLPGAAPVNLLLTRDGPRAG